MLQIQLNGQVFTVSGLINVSSGPVVPAAPSNLDIRDESTDGAVTLTWINNAPSTDGIEIWRSDNGAPAVVIATIGVDTQYTDNTFPAIPGNYSEYTVRALASGVPSLFSNPAGAAEELQALGLLVYNYPNLIVHFGGFISQTTTVTEISFPLLRVFNADFILDEPLTTFNLNSLVRVVGTLVIAGTFVATFSFPALTTIFAGSFNLSDNNSVTDISAPALTTLGDAIEALGCPFLANVSIPVISSVPGNVNFNSATLNQLDLSSLTQIGGTLLLLNANSLTNLSIANLATIGVDFFLFDALNIGTMTLTSLASVGGSLTFSNIAALALTFPALATVNEINIINSPADFTSLSLPSLTNSNGTFNVSNNGTLTSVSAPSLTNNGGDMLGLNCPVLDTLTLTSLATIGGAFDFNGSAIITANFPALVSLGAAFFLYDCPSLTSLILPSLVTVGNLDCHNGPSLATVQVPQWVVTDGTTISFDSCAVTVGNAGTGEGIDGILRRGALSPIASCDFELASGTNASPTGGFANADYITLTNAGNTVNIN